MIKDARAAQDRFPLALLSVVAICSVSITCILVALTLWLARWSELKLRKIIEAEICEYVNKVLRHDQYVLVDVGPLQMTSLGIIPAVKSLQVMLDGKQEEVKILRSNIGALCKRPGIPMYRLFLMSREVLQSPPFEDQLVNYGQHIQATVFDLRLKVLNLLKRKDAMLLCWKVMEQVETVKDLHDLGDLWVSN